MLWLPHGGLIMKKKQKKQKKRGMSLEEKYLEIYLKKFIKPREIQTWVTYGVNEELIIWNFNWTTNYF